ncbi:MAG: STAS-like domain-containing protein [Candidatus Poribacteria bacterium]|nr:STAS-like domain-containing protein [Candidatus Poribacteria bacterium]
MSKNIRISMFEVVGSPFCVASDDGQKIYDHLDAALKADWNVVLSFRNVTALTSAFLSVAVGQLYGMFNEEKIQTLLKIEDAEPQDLALLDRVIRNAKLYFEDPKRFNQAVREVMGDDDDEE